MYINNSKRKYNPRELSAFDKSTFFTCIDWKPKGRKVRHECKTYKDALKLAKRILLNNANSKILIYAVSGTNYACVITSRIMQQGRNKTIYVGRR